MLVIRIVGFLVLLAIGGSFLLFVLKRDRRYLRLAGQILRYAVILLAIVMAFYVLERVILVL
ncbi:MAG: hypothetical protein IPK20_25445 [Betaproteobacteria bacterium]|nr:hypothetical protein [Betaproteobacteria bacterium]